MDYSFESRGSEFLAPEDAFRADDTPVTVACVGWTGQPMANHYSRKLLAPLIYQAELPRDGLPTFSDFLSVPLRQTQIRTSN